MRGNSSSVNIDESSSVNIDESSTIKHWPIKMEQKYSFNSREYPPLILFINGSCHLWLMIPSSEFFLVNKNLFPVFRIGNTGNQIGQ